MRKLRRIALRGLVGFVVVVAVALISTLDRVDHQPYFRTPYYTRTIAQLRSNAAINTVVRGELQAGFGKALLTPALNAPQDDPSQGKFRAVPLAGFNERNGRPATGVHDDLYVKAVAIRVEDREAIMVGIDALIVPREVSDAAAERLQREVGLRRGQIYFGATHTHAGLGGWGEGVLGEKFAGGFQPGVRTWMVECIVNAVRAARADLKPASFGHDSFAAPEFVRNRVVGELGKVDPEFSYLVFKQREGRTAVVGSYSAHATVLSGKTMEFSADYPGCWQRAVEESGTDMAMFMAAAVGSHGPVPGEKGFKGTERMGGLLGQALRERLPQTSFTNVVAFGVLSTDIALPPLNVRVTDGVRLRPWLAAKFLPPLRDSFLQGFRIADTVWVATPCDFSGELALGIKDSLHTRGFTANITSFNGDYIGYVISTRYYHMNGYEPRLMSFYGPNVPDYLDELIRTLTTELTKN